MGTMPPPPFSPLALSVDDQLPADIQLVMAFPAPLAPDHCAAAVRRGLVAFPHLTGTLEESPHPGRIVPADGGFNLESVISQAAFSVRDLEAMPIDEQSHHFIPRSMDPTSPGSLFQVRLTHLPPPHPAILGLRVSHAAVDGTGLALFFQHCTAESRGVDPPRVFHERSDGIGTCLDGPDHPPHGYRESQEGQEGHVADLDVAAHRVPTIFAIPVATVGTRFQTSSILHARLRLGAWLCVETAARCPEFSEVALWCDPRGTHGIPATFTGNTGCYLHFPLREIPADDLACHLSKMTKRRGFQQIADTHRRIKQAEARGRPMVWNGAASGALQLNLVPHAVAGTDFGAGLPAFALLLSRNSSGLRISLTPDATRFLVEVCLPGGAGDSLIESCHAAGLRPAVWCRGRQALEP